ncbi:MAG: trypsin-like peptidase domain-containing protein [Anaerolineales bacterium]
MKKRNLFLFTILTAGVLFGCGLITSTAPILGVSPTPTPNVAVAPVSADAAAALDHDLESIYQQVSPSVVLITVFQKSGSESSTGARGTQVVSGSGFVWDTQGDIVTNNHVMENAASISVTFPGGSPVDATLVGADPGSDLAVIRVKADPALLKPVTLGDSNAVQVGQIAIVIGYPFALDSTMTSGIVSGLSRLLPVVASGGNGLLYSIPDVIQTDAPINPGNSGGVLVNDLGEVIGVPSANISTSGSSAGIGFAIPSNIVIMEVPSLIANGSYPHAYLGISGETLIPDLAAAMGLDPNTRGLLIADVQTGGPADKAGLRGSATPAVIHGISATIGGDIITAADGKPIASFEDLIRYMFLSKKTGDTMQVSILRDGKTMMVEVTFTALPGQ